MSAPKISAVVLIGAGNLATHLGSALVKAGVKVVQVVNRTEIKGLKLAEKLGAGFTSDLNETDQSADLYILAVSDEAIPVTAEKLKLHNKLLVHTSGSVNMDVLKKGSAEIGVFYPVQTFSGIRSRSFMNIPICLEANNKENLLMLANLGGRLSKAVYHLDSNQRKVLHLTAVFASNFTNFMYTVAQDLLKKHDISYDLLIPLIGQTAKNAFHEEAFKLQTGPAVRGDKKIMEEHRRLLAGDPGYLEIYNLISDGIIKLKKRDG